MQPYHFEVVDIFGRSYSFTTYERAKRGLSLMLAPSAIYKVYANGERKRMGN